MTLPDFLGIGAQRAGSSWLYIQLRAHPDIYIPERKEVHFFDRNYDRGLDWYQAFFPAGEKASRYQAIGEITPMYIYDPRVPARIKEHTPACRFIAILRNPVDRAYSHYGLIIRDSEARGSFRSILDKRPEVFARGLYTEQLKRYWDYFPRSRLLVLVFEHIKSEPEKVLKKVAEFLSVDASKFRPDLAEKPVNVSSLPRFPRVRTTAVRVRRFLWNHDLDWAVNAFRAMGVRHFFGNRGALPPMDEGIRTELYAKYEPEIAALEDLLQQDLSLWKEPPV